MSNIAKGKGQRLIPEILLKYLEKQNKKYPDPESLGTEVTANVEPVGGESDLTSIKIGNTVYLIPSNGTPLLEDIEDSAGNKRFIEGELTAGATGATLSYKKWSLSGTHLMIVLVGTISSDLTDYTSLANVTLPSYIKSKIYALGTNAQLVSVAKGFFIKDTQYTATEYTFNLRKQSNDFYIIPAQAITISGTYNFRIQFDLLIDTDYS